MHKCLKCGKEVENIEDISSGCSCGSKVFIYQRKPGEAKIKVEIASKKDNNSETKSSSAEVYKNSVASAPIYNDSNNHFDYSNLSEIKLIEGAKITEVEHNPKFEIENIHQLSRGIYEVDLMGLKNGPLVLKDSDGVYYVRLPFTQNLDDK